MKICLLGPTHPFRGGIAHYTTLLCSALRARHEVRFFSFKRQYPRILFPGKTDRDTSESALRVDDVEYLLDSMNPLTWRRTAQAIVDARPEMLLLPWWVAFWAPHFAYIISYVKRRTEAEVVLLCHNVVEHESSWLKKRATRAVLSKGDRFITHSQEETQRLTDLLGADVNVTTAYLPTFAELKTMEYTRQAAHEELDLDGQSLLFFGFVREYKGLHVLLDALPEVLEQRPVTLLVVGEFWKDKNEYLAQIERLKIAENVRIVDRYVANEEMPLYFCAADLVVQPYTTATGSGVLQLAYGFDRPVIATRVGSLAEVVEDGVNGRLVAAENPEELAQAIVDSLEEETLARYNENAAKTKEKFSWARMAEIVAAEHSDA